MTGRIIIFVIHLSLAILCFATSVYWLMFAILTITGIYALFSGRNVVSRFFKSYRFMQYVTGIPAIIVLAIALRLFLFEIYDIASSSMEKTIVPGDKILINKLFLGPVLPRSPIEIPWINILYYLNPSNRDKTDSIWWDYRRLTGFTEIRHKDIVVFFSLSKDKKVYIKRCIALPGDTLLIDNSNVKIDGTEQESPELLMLRYRLFTRDLNKLMFILDSLEVRHYRNLEEKDSGKLVISLTMDQKKILKGSSCVDSIRRNLEYYGKGFTTFLNGEGFEWTFDNFGPITIPYSGMSIPLNYNNYIIYKKVIQSSEGQKIEYQSNQVLINNKPATHYVFKKNYYFMMGDNRYDSKDSRYIGLIPEETLIGITKRILYSTHNGKFQWKRFFKRI